MSLSTVKFAVVAVALLVSALAFRSWLASHDEQQRLQSTLATQKQIIDAVDARERTRDAALHQTLAQIEKLKRETQTPEQIVRDLPKYLPLPAPITLVKNAASAAATSAAAAMREHGEPSQNVARSALSAVTFPHPSTDPDSSTRSEPSAPEGSQPTGPSKSHNQGVSICPTPERCAPERAGIDAASQLPSKKFDVLGSGQTASPNARSSPCAEATDCWAQIPAADLKPIYNYVQDCRACESQLAVAKQNANDDAAKIAALTRERDAAETAAKGGTFWRRLRSKATWFVIGAAVGYIARKHPRCRRNGRKRRNLLASPPQ